MLQVSSGLGNSSVCGGDSATITTAAVVEAAAVNLTNNGGGGGSGGGSIPAVPDGFEKETRVRDDEGERNFAGNRWPRDETLVLLKIRSDMDAAFRDSTLKAPLWDEVSRKLAELGYHRNGKKCKEKFENIYKYHKRTKECRSGRQDSKNYRFFEELELLNSRHPSLPSPPQIKTQPPSAAVAIMLKPSSVTQNATIPCPNSSSDFATSTSTSATTSSSGKESELNGTTKKKRRKMGDYFETLMKEVLEKQENLQKKFLEALEKCEKDRVEREEAWKMQELTRVKRERDILAQERAISAAKDAAVIAFLQKISDQTNPNPLQFSEIPIQIPNSNPVPLPNKKIAINIDQKENSMVENLTTVGSSRWPKAEVEALIRLRANLELQYQDYESPKGPLWENISSSMKKLGYNRNSKRCKEKWENINKYFKRVKESKKKRPDDSKTCPYFEMLESLCERKSKKIDDNNTTNNNNFLGSLKPEDILMQMMLQTQQLRSESLIEDGTESENADQNEEDDGENNDEDDDEDEDEDEDDNGDNYQIVVNDNNSSCAVMNME